MTEKLSMPACTRSPCLALENLYTGKEATVRTGHGTTDWFQIRRGVHQACILSPCLFNLYAEYFIRNVGLEEAHARIKIAWRIPGTEEPDGLPSMGSHRVGHDSDMQMIPPLWQKVKRN